MREAPERGAAPRRGVALICTFALAAGFTFAGLALSAPLFWPGELAVSFAWQAGWSICGLGALFFALRRPRRALVALLLALGLIVPELRLWLPAAGTGDLQEGETELRVAALNLYFFNEDDQGVRLWLEAHNPDVVVCVELSPFWRSTLDDWRDLYPERLISPGAEDWGELRFGTAVLAKQPFLRSGLVDAPYGHPLLEAVLEVSGQELTVRGAHPLYPGSPWLRHKRDAVLETLAAQPWDDHGILAGDLNVTSTSPAFRSLLAESGLVDSRQGFGRQPTYRLYGLSLAIDHVLVGEALRVLERRTTPLVGSDHRAVLVRLAVPAGSG